MNLQVLAQQPYSNRAPFLGAGYFIREPRTNKKERVKGTSGVPSLPSSAVAEGGLADDAPGSRRA